MAAWIAALACLLHLIGSSSCNIDTQEPIRRAAPNLQDNGYFGYSLVLHQVAVPGNRMEALQNTRIVVSAPKVTVPNAQVDNTGAIYTCPIMMGMNCEGLVGSGSGDDLRLFDTEGNNDDEEKSEQFLGGSMASTGDSFIVCAHRYALASGNDFRTPIGRCYTTTNRNLRNFEVLEPCPIGDDGLGGGSGGVCQAGTSSVITARGNGFTYGMGAPGYFSWRGVVIRSAGNSLVRQDSGEGTSRDSYQGYAITAGYFLSVDTQDYAVSAPKFQNYFGSVNIVTNDNELDIVSQPDLTGTQMGEYYGFSILRANLIGDDFDELLVGAPMYRANSTQPETGRVYIYSNTGGSLEFVRTIEGFSSFSRFGYAMANMGDINGDGFDDIAISAPFGGINDENSGTVYIYHSSRTQSILTTEPQQIIVGSELSLNTDLSTLRGFGTSLASGVDVDDNTYQDLAIGSFISQEVFLLRTRPLAFVTQTLTADPQIVNVMNTTDPACALEGVAMACFQLRACVTYSGDGVSNTLTFQFTVAADTNSIERRLIFNSNQDTTIAMDVMATKDSEICLPLIVYVVTNIVDVFNPFIIDFDVGMEEVELQQRDGDVDPSDFSSYPVVSNTGVSSLQIETLKDCNGELCIPDLAISVNGYTAILEDGTSLDTSNITLGAVRNMVVVTDVENIGEDAFQASITVTAPSNLVEISRLIGSDVDNTNPVTLICPTREDVVENNMPLTRVTCSIGNPLAGPDVTLRVSTFLVPRSELVGDEGTVSVGFSVTSVNAENENNLGNNMATAEMNIVAKADVSIDAQGLVIPEQISYSNNVSNDTIMNVTQLGPTFSASFVVRNSGPSVVRTVSLNINWPLRTTENDQSYILYPAQITTSGTGATVTCVNTFINPDELDLTDIIEIDELEDQVTIDDGEGKKRRRRSIASRPAHLRRKLRKRQATVTETEDVEETVIETVNRTLSCADTEAEMLNCVQIQCTIIGLQGGSNDQARVDITGFLDERFFANSVDRFNIIPTAEVDIVNGDFIIQQTPTEGKTSMAMIRVIPATGPVTVESNPVPWWVIFLPILAAVIIIGIIGGVLWGLGFFKRRQHEALKQRKEEFQNLQANGEGPAVASEGTNM